MTNRRRIAHPLSLALYVLLLFVAPSFGDGPAESAPPPAEAPLVNVESRPAESTAQATLLERALALEAGVASIIDAVRPAVVAIEVSGRDERGRLRRGGGSGVVIDPAGQVLTNFHVAGWADEVVVVLSGRRRVEAKLVGVDAEGDLALLSLTEEGPWPSVDLGDSDALRVGEWVFAMGNPKGVSLDGRATVTWGTVTAVHAIGGGELGRELFYGDAIQIDAEINPGNSGGPLFDMAGRLVGINGRIASRFRVATGAVNANVGFAVPASQISRFLPLLREGREVRHGYLGVRVESGGTPGSVEVVLVAPESAAARCGLLPGDRIVAIDGESIFSPVRVTNVLSSRPAGAHVAVRVRRGDEERILVAELTVRPEEVR